MSIAVTPGMIDTACAAFDDGTGDPSDGKRRMERALRAALAEEARGDLADKLTVELYHRSREVRALKGALKEAAYFILAPAEDLKESVLYRIRTAVAMAEGRP